MIWLSDGNGNSNMMQCRAEFIWGKNKNMKIYTMYASMEDIG